MSTVDEDNLDGVTREELVRAQIAKHKELLTPGTPVTTELAGLREEMRNIRDVLHDILAEQQHLRNHIQPKVEKVGEPKNFSGAKK